ncbi:MAG: hypothetical protein L7V86_26295 [Verrucomicrobiales bacterium]|nr:hypothetical protein [Verrucomicrobiales bacterium]
MNLKNSSNYFTSRRAQLRKERYLKSMHRKPIMTQTRSARFEAVEHVGNAIGHGLGIEFYDCLAAQRGVPNAERGKDIPLSLVLNPHG